MIETSCRLAVSLAGAAQRRLMIVQFHRVLSAPDSLLESEPDTVRFERQIGWLVRNFNILTVGDALGLLYSRHLPSRALCITFDDGYRDNADNALPILLKHGIRGTFFVTTGFREFGMMWNDRIIEALRHWPQDTIDLTRHGLKTLELPVDRASAVESLLREIKYLPFAQREALADELLAASGAANQRMMLSEEEIQRLHRAGMEIGGHTEGHPILRDLPDESAMEQITRNKATLEAITGSPLTTFAYPNGRPYEDFDARHVEMVRTAGYRYALTTSAGTATARTDPYQVPRFTPADRTKPRYLARLMINYFRNPETV